MIRGLLVVFAFCCLSSVAMAENVVLSSGTPVLLALETDVSLKALKVGEKVPASAAMDVTDGQGRLLVTKGAPAMLEAITKDNTPAGQSSRHMQLNAVSVETADHQQLPLKGFSISTVPSGKHVRSYAIGFIIPPIFIVRKPMPSNMKEGTIIESNVSQDTNIAPQPAP
jgi:hypothetical protein